MSDRLIRTASTAIHCLRIFGHVVVALALFLWSLIELLVVRSVYFLAPFMCWKFCVLAHVAGAFAYPWEVIRHPITSYHLLTNQHVYPATRTTLTLYLAIASSLVFNLYVLGRMRILGRKRSGAERERRSLDHEVTELWGERVRFLTGLFWPQDDGLPRPERTPLSPAS